MEDWCWCSLTSALLAVSFGGEISVRDDVVERKAVQRRWGSGPKEGWRSALALELSKAVSHARFSHVHVKLIVCIHFQPQSHGNFVQRCARVNDR